MASHTGKHCRLVNEDDDPPSPSPNVDARLAVSTITYATVVLTTTTILVSYVIAVSLKHEPAWLPMISDCATKAPEMYIFRYGMLVAAALLASNVLIVHAATKATYSLAKMAMTCGLLASFGLGLLTAVNVHEFSAIHGAGAVVFFVGYQVFMTTISFNAAYDARVSRASLNMKRVAAVISLVAILGIGGMASKWSHFRLPIAICEWTSTLMIQVFNLSFVHDLMNTNLLVTGNIQGQGFNRRKLGNHV